MSNKPTNDDARDVVKPFRVEGGTFVCIASGPSLCQEQIDTIGKVKEELRNDHLVVIGCNDNWKWKYKDKFICDHLYAADYSWWKIHIGKIDKAGFPKKNRWIPVMKSVANDMNLIHIPCTTGKGLSNGPKLHCLQHSGAQIIGLSFFMGASKIILIGYDMGVPKGSQVHWFGDHCKGLRNTPASYSKWVHHYDDLTNGLKTHNVDFVNCTINSSLNQMRRGILEEELV